MMFLIPSFFVMLQLCWGDLLQGLLLDWDDSDFFEFCGTLELRSSLPRRVGPRSEAPAGICCVQRFLVV